jgi:hypothetical protein
MNDTDESLPDMRPALIIWSEHLDPSTITELLGVSPTESHVKGDINRWGVKKEDGAWMLYGDRKHFATVAECVDNFLSRFPRGIERLADVPAVRSRIEIDIGYRADYPVVDLENRHLRLLAAVNGEFVTTLCDLSRPEVQS